MPKAPRINYAAAGAWPQWSPVPRNPWCLVFPSGEYVRDREGNARRFATGDAAERWAEKNKIPTEA